MARRMSDKKHILARIADALERLAPAPTPATDWLSSPAYVLASGAVRPVARIEAPRLDLLKGIDAQRERIAENVARKETEANRLIDGLIDYRSAA